MITEAITDRLTNVNAKIGISYIDLMEDQEFFWGNQQVFHGSGAIMIMALVECFKQIEAGVLSETDVYRIAKDSPLDAEFSSYGVLRYLRDGVELSVSDLYNLMSTVSDNMAFNKLVDILGMEEINRTFSELGYKDMHLNRKIDDEEQMKKGIQNFISIPELAAIFHRIFRGQMISKKASKKMLTLLKQHQRTSMIPYIFKESVSVAHLTGFDEDIIMDGGIIFTERPFILAIAITDMDIRKAETLMRDITQICYMQTQRIEEPDF